MILKVGNGTTQTFCNLFATTNLASHWTLCLHNVGHPSQVAVAPSRLSLKHMYTHMPAVLNDLMILFTATISIMCLLEAYRYILMNFKTCNAQIEKKNWIDLI